jgi:hypothetical protein
MVIPQHLVDDFLALGFRLLDEPCCSGARVLPPNVSVNRVTTNNHRLAEQEKCPAATPSRTGQKNEQCQKYKRALTRAS